MSYFEILIFEILQNRDAVTNNIMHVATADISG
jgi:hypothetical protein